MHPILASTLLLALPLLSTATPLNLNFPRTTTACHSYILINTRGTGEPQGESAGFHTMIASILHSVPGGASYNTSYPADITQHTTLAGANDIIALISQGTQICPQQEYALLGYSQGATVTDRVLQYFPPSSQEGQRIRGVVLIGNPYHVPNRNGNVDERCGASTAGASGLGLGDDPYEIPDAWYATGKVRDICFTDDQVCNGVNLGNVFSGSHLKYGSEESVQVCGASFVAGRLSGWWEE
jgi:hypothetical protein